MQKCIAGSKLTAQYMKFIKKLMPEKYKAVLRKVTNSLIQGENIIESKKKWNKLAAKNSRYFVMTDLGESITEAEFRETGEKDFKELIEDDDLIKNILGDSREKTALEIGCGTGRITEFLSKKFRKVFAVDISEKMIEEGRQRLKDTANVEFATVDGMSYPAISDSSIDFVFSFIVFQHMSNKKVIKKNLEEVKRVLKNDGIAKIQVRGLPTDKRNWFYGPSFTKKEVEKLAHEIEIKIVKTEGENRRYFWLWFSK